MELYCVAGQTIFPMTKLKDGVPDGLFHPYPDAYDVVGYVSYPVDAVNDGNVDKDRAIMRTKEEYDAR